MRVQSIAFVLAMAFDMILSIQVPTVPFNGVWITTLQADGTTLTESLDFPDLAPIISTTNGNALISRNIHYPRLAWPDGDCWGYQLDHSGVDGSADGLRNWAGTGGNDLCSGSSSNEFLFVNVEETIVYYCIDTLNACGNLDIDDVNYALGQMDAHCAAYEASWFKWPGSFEIVGKARVTDNVCV